MKPLNPGWRFALPWAITLRPFGASEGLNGYAVGCEGTGVGCPGSGAGDLYPGDVLGTRVHSVFDGDEVFYFEPQRGGLR